MDFDGPMCMQFGQERNANVGDCKNSGANVIQLRRIKKLKIPGIPDVKNTLLTVVTERQGQNKLYTFRVLYSDGVPEYHTLAIYPDIGGPTSCVREPIPAAKYTPAADTSSNGVSQSPQRTYKVCVWRR